MTMLTTDAIKHIAHLAKLTIPEEDNALLQNELNKILDMVAKMDTVNTDKVEPLAHPYDEKQSLREDAVTEPNQRELFQRIAPQTQAGLYIVPAVIDNND